MVDLRCQQQQQQQKFEFSQTNKQQEKEVNFIQFGNERNKKN